MRALVVVALLMGCERDVSQSKHSELCSAVAIQVGVMADSVESICPARIPTEPTSTVIGHCSVDAEAALINLALWGHGVELCRKGYAPIPRTAWRQLAENLQ